MIFDDHDIRDDWNTSWTWKHEMEQTSWWHDRIVGGLASYWVYQHLGNLGPQDRAADELWQRIVAHQGPDELDVTAELDALADRADQEPESYRWSFSRDFDTQARLVVVDSRAARVLDPDRRSILDDDEMAWFDEQLQGGFDHVLVGTSLPFLLAPGLHHGEAFSEALAEGAWGRRAARSASGCGRRPTWSTGRRSSRASARWPGSSSRSPRGSAGGPRGRSRSSPATCTTATSRGPGRAGAQGQVVSEIVQAVCSPIRNPLPRFMHAVTSGAARKPVGRFARGLARLAKVPDPPLDWRLSRGPWYDNNLAILELRNSGLRLWWTAGEAVDRPDRPVLRRVATIDPIG